MTEFLIEGPQSSKITVLLAHGAGAPMNSVSMSLFSTTFAAAGLRVARFEFAYMAARRNGSRKPPPRAETLVPEYLQAVTDLQSTGTLVIGGKSMGGRVASMAADELFADGAVSGLVCLGYPFHPPKKPDALRTAHLENLAAPCLICQGTRDPFGTKEEVSNYKLSSTIEIRWFEDGDHELKPRKRVTNCSAEDYARLAATVVADWAARL